MASLFKLVGEVFIDTSKANESMSKVGASAEESTNKFTTIGTTMQSVGRKMTQTGAVLTAGVTMPILGIGMTSVKTAADFEASMSNVSALSGATGDDLAALEAKAREMGSSTKFSATEAADAFSYMALAGWDTNSMLVGIEPILNLATAANMDLAEASDIVTDYLTAFGLTADDASGFVDQMAYAMANSNTDVTMLGEAYKNCASTATSMGISVEDTTAALMVMANAGVKGGEAGTALNGIMTRLATDTNGCATELAELGVEVYNSDGTMRGFGDIMTDMGAALANMTDEERANIQQKIAGKSAYSDLAILLEDLDTGAERTTSSFEDYRTALSDCDGTAEDMAATMQDNLNGQLTTLKSSLEEGAIAIGQALLPMVKQLTQFIQNLVNWFNNLSEGQQQFVIKAALVAAAIGPILMVVGMLITSIGSIIALVPMISSAIVSVKLAMSSLLMTLSLNPAILVIAGIVALVTAFILLWNNCEGFRNFWISLWEGIKPVVSTVVDSVVTFFTNLWTSIQTIWTSITTAVQTAWQTIQNVISVAVQLIWSIIQFALQIWLIPWMLIWQLFGDQLTAAWNAIVTFITTVINGIATFIQTVWNGIVAFMTPILEGIRTVFQTVWTAIQTVITTVFTIVSSIIQTYINIWRTIITTVLNAIRTVFTTVWNTIKTTVTTVINAIKSAIEGPLNAVSATVSSILNGIRNTFTTVFNGIKNTVSTVVNWLKGVFNFSWSLPNIKLPHFTKSGEFSLNPPSVPTFSVSWYDKAMDEAMVLNSPTIFGMAGGKLLGGGESGNEVIAGESHLIDMITKATGTKELVDFMRENMSQMVAAGVSAAMNSYEINWNDRELGRMVKKYGY